MPHRSMQDSLERFVNANSQDNRALDELAAGVALLGSTGFSYKAVLQNTSDLYEQFQEAFAKRTDLFDPSYEASEALRVVGRRAADTYSVSGDRAFGAIHETITTAPR